MKLIRYSLPLLFSSYRERCILFSQHKLKRKSDVSFNTVFVLIDALFSDVFARLQFHTLFRLYFKNAYSFSRDHIRSFFFYFDTWRCSLERSLRIVLTLFDRIIFEFQWFFSTFDLTTLMRDDRLPTTKFLHFSREFKFGLNSMEKCWFQQLQQVVQDNTSLYFDREGEET